MKKSYSGVASIIKNQEGEYLLHLRDYNTKNMPGQWCLVGGHVEEGEDILTSAKREIKEETNLTPRSCIYFKDIVFNSKDIGIFFAEVDTEKEEVILGEGVELRFFKGDEFVNLYESVDYKNPYLDCLKDHITKPI